MSAWRDVCNLYGGALVGWGVFGLYAGLSPARCAAVVLAGTFIAYLPDMASRGGRRWPVACSSVRRGRTR